MSRRPPPATVDAERVADDDRLRSNYVRELLWEAEHDTPSPPANEIPTTIMQFWDNASAIPADVSELAPPHRRLSYHRHQPSLALLDA